MNENIKYYPKSYVMSENLKSFFTAITNDQKLQKQLYETKNLSGVVIIADALGFSVTGAEILQSQAGRVLAIIEEQSEDVERLTSGIKPKTGAQWGRGGGGYLDSAGYWLNQLASPTGITMIEKQVNAFIEKANQETELKKELLNARTFNDLAYLFQKNEYEITAVELLSYQAQKILALNEDEAKRVSNGIILQYIEK